MEYLGNFKDYIQDSWTDEIIALPKEWPKPFCDTSTEHERLSKIGYDLSTSHWAVVEPWHVGFTINFPFIKNLTHWWCARLFPGQFMPMHIDPHPEGQQGKMYWIPMQDYHSGHVFIVKDELIKDYKKGDVFAFDNLNDYHGSANIGSIPKLTLIVVDNE
jgi:hypothetical protein